MSIKMAMSSALAMYLAMNATLRTVKGSPTPDVRPSRLRSRSSTDDLFRAGHESPIPPGDAWDLERGAEVVLGQLLAKLPSIGNRNWNNAARATGNPSGTLPPIR